MQAPQEKRPAPLLLVTDSDASRRAELERGLVTAGFRVEGTGDEGQTLRSMAGGEPAAVLLEHDFPGGGIELCRRLREAAGERVPPIVMLVGREALDTLPEARAAGVSDFLEVPYHQALLEHRVRSVLELAERLTAAPPASSAPASPFGATLEGFRSQLTAAIARAGRLDRNVAVLAVRGALDGELRAAASLGVALRAAVDDFRGRRSGGAEPTSVELALVENGGLLLMPELERVQDAARLGAQVRAAVAANGSAGRGIGVAIAPADGTEADELVGRALAAAEVARQEGQLGPRFHNGAMDRWTVERLALEESLREALELDQLVVHYQPKMEVASRRIVGLEALVRWEHPELGRISPAQFIPLAEETGLIVPIGEWVLRAACLQNQRWQEQGLPAVRMAVNLSPVQFRQPDLVESIERVLTETGLDPACLELELTEGMLMEQVRATSEQLERLKRAGIHLTIDDFGTGYSSLSYLRRFPIDTLKIDRSFVRDVTTNADDAAIVTSVILMGRALKLSVVAEGVETHSQLSFLEVLNCDQIQGYLISAAVPADRVPEFLSGPAL